ncbi:MAG: hypothetical protein IT321_08745 [Anaerolineae bacterium]|nr:hypothetical protein [Anaerolineae bacterium]
MPAFDQCHDQVVRALQKEGWRLEKSPAKLSLPPRLIYVDLLMSRGNNGIQKRIALVEVKCFPDEDSTTRDLYTAIGQYLIYRAMITELDIGLDLYLSIPVQIYQTIFDKAVQRVVAESHIKLIIVDLVAERVEKWLH